MTTVAAGLASAAFVLASGGAGDTGEEVTEELRQVTWWGSDLRGDELLAGLLVAAVGYGIARLVGWLLKRFLRARGRTASYAAIFGTITSSLITFVAVGIGATIAFPSINFAGVFGGLGLGALVVSIAGQSIFSDVFAGMMMVIREPYREGDQVEIGDVRGTIVEINLRETVVRTFRGQRVVIPNSTVYDAVVRVQTGYERRMTVVQVGVAYDTDLERAKRLLLDVARSTPRSLEEPAPGVLVSAIDPNSIQLDVSVWTGSHQIEEIETLDHLIPEIIRVLGENGIDMPPNTVRVQERATPLRRAAGA